MKHLIFLGILLSALSMACQPDEEIVASGAVRLRFEQDTIQFDTLFTGEQSITRRLKVYNPSANTVLIDQISLALGGASPYTLYVNGQPGWQFGQTPLLGGDSLLLLLETRLPETEDVRPYLAEDAIQFYNKGLQQEVLVLAYGQNALVVGDSVLACDLVWDSPLPYIIEKSIMVDSLCSLTLTKGSRLYFKPGAYLYVKGSLLAEGDSAQNDRILLRNHRRDASYENLPGQWGGVVFLPGSKDNRLRYTDIRNADYGIYLGTPDEDKDPDLLLEYCRIENTLLAGIIAYSSDLEAHNTLVNTSAQYTVANLAGGYYTYQHCTFVNYFFQREQVPALVLSDYVQLSDASEISEPLFVQLENSIVWGSLNSLPEVLVEQMDPGQVNIQASHNLLRTSDAAWEGNGNILANQTDFLRFRSIASYDYRPDTLSPAIDQGKQLDFQTDLLGRKRDELPDIGALEYIVIPEDE